MKKLLSLLCAVLLLATFMTSCSKEKISVKDISTGEGKKLVVSFLEAGYGRDFMEQWAEKFKAKKKAEGVDITIELKGDPSYGTVAATLPAGPNANSVDLYFSALVKVKEIVTAGEKYISGYPIALEDLSDVYNQASDVSGKTIKEKMQQDYVAFHTNENGKQYSMSWASDPCGLVVNTAVLDEVFGAGKYTLPRTTADLEKMSTDVTKSGKAKGISYPGQTGYWKYVLTVWWAQYEGINKYNQFFSGKVFDEDLQKDIYSPEIFDQLGILKSLTALENLISKQENLVQGCNSTYFTTLQTQFLQGSAAFMPNGGWLENEMKDFKNPKISMIRTPVLSSIIEKTPTIKDDATLGKVIDFVDGNGTVPAGVSPADIEVVKLARFITFDTGYDFTAVIPAYADARNLAKEFLAYTTTNEAIEIFYNSTGGYIPIEFDYSKTEKSKNASQFGKSKIGLIDKKFKKITQSNNSILFSKNNLTPFLGVVPETILGASNPKDKKTAKELFESNSKKAKKEWNNYLSVAGISS